MKRPGATFIGWGSFIGIHLLTNHILNVKLCLSWLKTRTPRKHRLFQGLKPLLVAPYPQLWLSTRHLKLMNR